MEYISNHTADRTFAALLSVCSLFGTPANLLACYFFCTRLNRNSNNTYFTRLYIVVSLVDTVICVCIIPALPSLASENRQINALYSNGVACTVLALCSTLAEAMSVFLIALISTSRAVLLYSPRKVFNPVLAWVLPFIYGMLHLGLNTVLILLDFQVARYAESGARCFLVASDKDVPESSQVFTPEMVNMVATSILTWVCFLILPMPFIITSCCMIVYILFRQQRRPSSANQASSSSRMHCDAAVTTLVVTLLYILCNIPVTVFSVLVVSNLYTLIASTEGDVSIISVFQAIRFYDPYLWLSLMIATVVINSTLNPVVYLWRMKPFRSFVMGIKMVRALYGSRATVDTTNNSTRSV